MAKSQLHTPMGELRPRGALRTCRSALLTGVAVLSVAMLSNVAHAHSINQALAQFYTSNPNLKALQLGIASSNEGVNEVSGGAMPQVSLSVQSQPGRAYGYNTQAGDYVSNSGNLGIGLNVSQAVDLSGSIGTQIESAYLGLQNGWTGYYAQEAGLMLEAVNVYMNVLSSRATVSLSGGAVTLLDAQKDAAQARFDQGVGTRTEVANINASLQGARSQVTQANGNLRIAESDFRRVFNMEPHGLEFPNHIPNLPRTMEQAVQRAMSSNQALIQAEASVRMAELDIIAAKAALGPSMQLTASANHNYNILRDNNNHSTNFSAGGQISVPLYQGGAGSSRVRQAELDRDVAKAQLAAARDNTRANVIAAWQNLKSLEASLNSIVSQVSASELALRSARAEVDAGTATYIDSLNSENALTDAQVSLTTTRARVVVAGYQLLQATGDLTAERMSLPVAAYFSPQNDLDGRIVQNFAADLYIPDDGQTQSTATPSFLRWAYDYAAQATAHVNRNGGN